MFLLAELEAAAAVHLAVTVALGEDGGYGCDYLTTGWFDRR
jgi:hypothetical protein